MNAWTDRVKWVGPSPWKAPLGAWRFRAVLCGVEAEVRLYGSHTGAHTATASVTAVVAGKEVRRRVEGCAGKRDSVEHVVLALRDIVGFGLGHGRPWESERTGKGQ